jgi:thioesterase domain-containing protein
LKGKNFSSTSSPESCEPVDAYARMNKLANAAFVAEALRKVTDVIVPLNDSGTASAFYCVHCLTGAATGFRFMAQMLGPQHRFYCIQTPTKKRNAEFVSSIESISQYYVDDLIKFQPEGSFVLGGYSAGAIIALEMAQQLLSRGREVSLLVILDGDIFNTGAEISYLDPYSWLKLMWYLPRWMTGVMMEDFSFRTLRRKARSKAIAIRKAVAARMRGETRHLATENFVTVNFNNCSADHEAYMKALFEIQFGYIPRKYDGRVVVYRAKLQWPTRLLRITAAWRKIAPRSEIVNVKGDHISIMRPPDGYATAKHLAERIAEIGSPRRSGERR